MSYGFSEPLQLAVFQALRNDAALTALVGDAIYDAEPQGGLPALYVRLGGEQVRDASDGSGAGAVHHFTLAVLSMTPGFASAKAAAGAISDALLGMPLTLSRGRLVSIRFERARARRIDNGNGREIELRFRARIADG